MHLIDFHRPSDKSLQKKYLYANVGVREMKDNIYLNGCEYTVHSFIYSFQLDKIWWFFNVYGYTSTLEWLVWNVACY